MLPHFARNDEMSLRIFAFANKKIVADLLANFMDKRLNMGVLCGVLNLDKNYELRAKMLKNKAQSGLNSVSSEKSPKAQNGLIV